MRFGYCSNSAPTRAVPIQWTSSLHNAVRHLPDPELLRLLIAHGAEVDRGDGDNNTPLNYVARDNALDLARVLLDAGAIRMWKPSAATPSWALPPPTPCERYCAFTAGADRLQFRDRSVDPIVKWVEHSRHVRGGKRTAFQRDRRQCSGESAWPRA